MDALENVRSNWVIATQFDDNDNLADVMIASGDRQILIGTNEGIAIRFKESEIPLLSRTAKGVVGMRLSANNEIVESSFMPLKQEDRTLLLVAKNGYGKKTPIEKIRLQERGGSGVTVPKSSSKSEDLANIICVSDGDQALVFSDEGEAIRLGAGSIPTQGRTSSGVRLTKLKKHDEIASEGTIPVYKQPKSS